MLLATPLGRKPKRPADFSSDLGGDSGRDLLAPDATPSKPLTPPITATSANGPIASVPAPQVGAPSKQPVLQAPQAPPQAAQSIAQMALGTSETAALKPGGIKPTSAPGLPAAPPPETAVPGGKIITSTAPTPQVGAPPVPVSAPSPVQAPPASQSMVRPKFDLFTPEGRAAQEAFTSKQSAANLAQSTETGRQAAIKDGAADMGTGPGSLSSYFAGPNTTELGATAAGKIFGPNGQPLTATPNLTPEAKARQAAGWALKFDANGGVQYLHTPAVNNANLVASTGASATNPDGSTVVSKGPDVLKYDPTAKIAALPPPVAPPAAAAAAATPAAPTAPVGLTQAQRNAALDAEDKAKNAKSQAIRQAQIEGAAANEAANKAAQEKMLADAAAAVPAPQVGPPGTSGAGGGGGTPVVGVGPSGTPALPSTPPADTAVPTATKVQPRTPVELPSITPQVAAPVDVTELDPVQQAMRAETMRNLSNPSPYDDALWQKEVDKAKASSDETWNANRKNLDADLAARGINWSSIAGDKLSDFNTAKSRSWDDKLTGFLSDRAAGIGSARAQASNAGNTERTYYDNLRQQATGNQFDVVKLQEALRQGQEGTALHWTKMGLDENQRGVTNASDATKLTEALRQGQEGTALDWTRLGVNALGTSTGGAADLAAGAAASAGNTGTGDYLAQWLAQFYGKKAPKPAVGDPASTVNYGLQ